MSKQEEIREEIDQALWDFAEGLIETPELKQKLSDLGVVIKVDRELPKAEFKYNDEHTRKLFSQQRDGIMMGAEMMKHNFVEAGYVAVEPLIEE